jgi:chromosome segregation ATPase
MSDSLSKTFGVEEIPQKTKTEIVTIDGEIIEGSGSIIQDDFDVGRNNLRQLILDGQAALQSALAVAQQSEHPRAFEVVGNLMKQLADINQQLLDLHQQKQKLEATKDEGSSPKTVNNNLFVGTTSDLNKVIKNLQRGE